MVRIRDLIHSVLARLPRREPGQGLIEYGLIISVVSIAAVALIMSMGPKVAAMFSTAGASAFPSDRRRKTGFAAVNTHEVLKRVADLSIQSWNYRNQDPAVRHIGPMAQDFSAAFDVGDDDTHIGLVDANGVALAAIQGLHRAARAQEMRLHAFEARLGALEGGTRVAREPGTVLIAR